MTDAATETMVLWTGLDPRDAPTPGATAGEGALQRTPPSGAIEQFELITGGSVRLPAARYLVGREVFTTEEIADAHGATRADLDATWSVLYRRVAETGPQVTTPYAIYFVGVNPPRDMSDDERAEFNDFYTNVHLVEVAERRHGLRAARYEMIHALRPPRAGAPQFLAVYELDEEWAAKRRHIGGPYSKGPEVWQRHTTPWRLWYRRLAD